MRLAARRLDNMYHAGWAWAGDTPFHHTKLVASHFGGTRNPLVISWPKGIKPDATPRSQFHHVNDIVPTIYEVLGITPPEVVDGFKQDPIDGASMAYTFADAKAPTHKLKQYFENNGSRGIYQRRLVRLHLRPADAMADREPRARHVGLQARTSGSFTTSRRTFRRPRISPRRNPERLAKMKELFLAEAKENKVFPIGAGIWLRIHPEDRAKSPYKAGVSMRRRPACRSLRTRSRAREQPRHY